MFCTLSMFSMNLFYPLWHFSYVFLYEFLRVSQVADVYNAPTHMVFYKLYFYYPILNFHSKFYQLTFSLCWEVIGCSCSILGSNSCNLFWCTSCMWNNGVAFHLHSIHLVFFLTSRFIYNIFNIFIAITICTKVAKNTFNFFFQTLFIQTNGSNSKNTKFLWFLSLCPWSALIQNEYW